MSRCLFWMEAGEVCFIVHDGATEVHEHSVGTQFVLHRSVGLRQWQYTGMTTQ